MKKKNVIILAGIIVAVYILMRYMLPIIVPFLFGWIIASRVERPAKWMEKTWKIKKEISSMLLILISVGVVFLALWFFLKIMWQELQQIFVWYPFVGRILYKGMVMCWELFADRVVEGIQNSVIGMMTFFSAVLITLISAFLFVKEQAAYRKRMNRYAFFKRAMSVAGRLKEAGGAYFKAQFILMMLISVICVLGLWILDSPFYLLGGIGLGIFDAFPLLGTGLILVPFGIFFIVQKKYYLGIGCLILYLITSLLREFLEPKLVGHKLGISPILVLVSIYAGIFVYGVSGVLLGPVSGILVCALYQEIKVNNEKNY